MSFRKNVINELNSIVNEIYTINNRLEEHINANNKVIIDAKKDFKELEKKTANLQREIANLKKENNLLLNGLNETRLAIKQIATILYNKGIIKIKEQKNERNNTKRKQSKQNISKHC